MAVEGIELEALLFQLDALNAVAALKDDFIDVLDEMIAEGETKIQALTIAASEALANAESRIKDIISGSVGNTTDILAGPGTIGNTITATSEWIKIVGVNPGVSICRLKKAIVSVIPSIVTTTIYDDVDAYLVTTKNSFVPTPKNNFNAMASFRKIRCTPANKTFNTAFNPQIMAGFPTAFRPQGNWSNGGGFVATAYDVPIPLGYEQCHEEGFAIWAWISNTGCSLKSRIIYDNNEYDTSFPNTGE